MLAYDYTVLAGTQGTVGHFKKDRMFELIERMRLPVVFFAEGGGGRPGDTDHPVVSALQVRAFALWAKLSGHVPRISIVAGNCFAGNAVIAGCSDLIVATKNASLGMAGPAMIAGGGLGDVRAEDVGPVEMQAPNGVLDVVVEDEEEAVATAKRLLGYFRGPVGGVVGSRPGSAPRRSARELPACLRRHADRPHDRRRRIRSRCCASASRRSWSPRWCASKDDPRASSRTTASTRPGVVTGEAADKATRFMQLCDAFGLPVVSLIDTPGYMVGPEAERDALVRHCCRMLIAGAALTVPTIAILLRRAYGLGAQAMAFGSLHEPLLTAAWPDAHARSDGAGRRGAPRDAPRPRGDRGRG